MNIAVFGGSRGVGRLVIEQALEQGHTIRALVRTPQNFEMSDERVTAVPGNVLNLADAAACVAGADAVICTLGSTGDNPDNVVSRGTKNIVAAMQEAGVKRLVVVTSLGVGDSKEQVPFVFKMLMKTVLKTAMQDKELQEQVVRDSGLEWVIVRPGGLTDNPAAGSYKVGTGKSVMAGQISRADVAAFVLQQLTDDTYLHQTPGIS